MSLGAEILFLDALSADPGSPVDGMMWCNTTEGVFKVRRGGVTHVLEDLKHKRNATVDPTANEDSGDGYEVGSIWINVTDDTVFVCADATEAAAVWTQTGGLPAVYAEIWENGGGTDITVTTGNTYYQWVSSTVGDVKGAPYVTASATTDDITIGASGGGRYLVNFNTSVEGPSNAVVKVAIHLNGSIQTDLEAHVRGAGTGVDRAASATGILNLSSGDDVDLRFTSNGNGDVLTVQAVNLTIVRIGGSVANTAFKHNYTATSDPTTSDDSNDGYTPGSRWINLTGNKDFVCVDSSVGAAVWKETTASGGGDPTVDEATATGDTTTTSGTDVVVNSITKTPASGDYLVWFTGSVDSSSSNAIIYISIYAGGSQEAGSEREFRRGAGQGNVTVPFTCVARVTVNGSQAIEGKWRTSGGTATMHERSLTLLKVAAV